MHAPLVFQQNSRLLKAFIILVLVILTGVAVVGVVFVKHIIEYQTIALGSMRVCTDTSSELLDDITVSNFTSFDSFTFSTRSEGVTDIYITDCQLYSVSINGQDILNSGRTLFFGEPLAIGSNITVDIKKESGVYDNNCSTILVVFEGWEDGDKYTKTGAKKQPYKGLCITEPITRILFTPQKNSYFSLELISPEKTWYSLTGDLLIFHVFAWCSISNTTNCSLPQKWFASEATVCVTATTRNSDIPCSDIEYGIQKATVQLWKKIVYLFTMIVISIMSGIRIIPGSYFVVELCRPKDRRKCNIIKFVFFTSGLATIAHILHYAINFFVEIYAL